MKILKLLALIMIVNYGSAFSQNVGVSSNISFTPTETLDIDGTSRVRSLTNGVVISSSTGVLTNTNGSTGQILGSGPSWVDPKTFSWTINGNDNTSVSTNFIGTINYTGFAFRTNNIERMRLQNDGQLTIGSTQAGGKLDVHQTSSNDVARFINYGNVNSILIRRTQGTQISPTPTSTTNTVLGRIDFQGYDGSGFTSASRIESNIDASGGTSVDMPGRLSFFTSNDGTGTLTEKLRISNSGTIQFNSYTTNGILRSTSGNGTITSGGSVSVSEGGTGSITLTGVVIGNGTSPMTGVIGTSNQFLRRNSANTAYEFVTLTPSIIGSPSGSGTSNYLARWTSSTNLGIGVTYDNGTNVGISNTTPGARLDVTGPSTGSGITIRAGGGGDIVLNTNGSLFFDGNYSYASGNYIRPVSTNTQSFFTSGTERVRITPGGNVGVGSTNPVEVMDVSGNIRSSGIVYWGNAGVRSESRDDAGLQGNAGSRSGFYETSSPNPSSSWPTGASSWWHLLDIRHSNAANNYAMQFSGSFFDQDLYFRKTNGSANTPWSKVLTSSSTLNQNYTSNISSTEILLSGNNTGSYSSGAGSGWTVGTWQSTGISVTKNIPSDHFAMITITARIEGDNLNRCPPSSSYFRIVRNGTSIGSTAVLTRTTTSNPTNFFYFLSSNLSMYLTDNVTGNNTYTLEFWLTNDNGACSVETVNICDYQLNVIQIRN